MDARLRLTPQEKHLKNPLDDLLMLSEPLITQEELAIRSIPVPIGDYEVRYENGVRKTVPV